MNGGLSGFTIGHSDIGGYTTIYQLDGLYQYSRTKEILLRWIESNTFSDMIMRTHIGLIP
jgi:alpha-glucosidase